MKRKYLQHVKKRKWTRTSALAPRGMWRETRTASKVIKYCKTGPSKPLTKLYCLDRNKICSKHKNCKIKIVKGRRPSTIHPKAFPPTWSEFVCPANQHSKKTIKKKAHKPLRTSRISQTVFRPYLIIIKSCYFDYRINKLFTRSRCWLAFRAVFTCYRRAQRIMSFFYINYPQIPEVVGTSDQSEFIDRKLDFFNSISPQYDLRLQSWLHEPLSKCLKVTSSQGRPCENRSAFGFYVPAGQQSNPIFDWRIQSQIGQKECTYSDYKRQQSACLWISDKLVSYHSPDLFFLCGHHLTPFVLYGDHLLNFPFPRLFFLPHPGK